MRDKKKVTLFVTRYFINGKVMYRDKNNFR